MLVDDVIPVLRHPRPASSRTLMGILETDILKEEFSFLGGYDPSDMGKIMWMG